MESVNSTDSPSFFSLMPEDQYMVLVRSTGMLSRPFIAPIESVCVWALEFLFPTTYTDIRDFLLKHKSPHADRLPLMNPFDVAVITLLYLVIVYGGMAYMSSRERWPMKTMSIVHNLILTVLSAYMCVSILWEAWRQGYSVVGNPVDQTEKGWQMAKYVWLFYCLKADEFFDTVIMVLRKSNRQITFLHVYHHCSIFVIWWLVTFIAPNGETYFSAALNSAVHVVMYAYYLSTSLSMPIRFIKRYITLFQMTQFGLFMLQATWDVVYFKFINPNAKETYPFGLALLLWVYMVTMLALFSNFFKHDRMREREQEKKGQ